MTKKLLQNHHRHTSDTFTVSSSANLPTLASGEILPITLNDAATRLVFEICYVTGISGNILTVERAQEGTSAQNWNVGDFIWNGPTAGTALLTNMPNPFIIPNATANDNPVALGQFLGNTGIIARTSGTGTTLTLTTATFTAPSNGYFLVEMLGFSSVALDGSTFSASLGSFSSDVNDYEAGASHAFGVLSVSAGQSSSFSFNITSATSGQIYIHSSVIFVPTP